MCRNARKKIGKVYYMGGPTKEGLWRGTIDSLLPYADRPMLEGPTEDAPYVTVIEHDMDLFPKMVEKVSSAICGLEDPNILKSFIT
jgi:hypothetical protein